jgi:hypothetical protein
MFLFSTALRPHLGPTKTVKQDISGGSFLGEILKLPESEADDLPQLLLSLRTHGAAVLTFSVSSWRGA